MISERSLFLVMDINELISELKSISKLQSISVVEAKRCSEIINLYLYKLNREQAFGVVRDELLIRYEDIINNYTDVEGVNFTDNFYLFIYTLAPNWGTYQREMLKYLAVPYKKWALRNFAALANEIKFSYQTREHHITFILRHGVTKGLYAPGKWMFTLIKTLLANGYTVDVIILNNCDQNFEKLARIHENLNLVKLSSKRAAINFYVLLDILQLTRPKLIFTEIEYGIPSILGIVWESLPIHFVCMGYYAIDWYRKIVYGMRV